MVKIISITIHVAFSSAYAFAHKPESFTQWAAGFATTLHKTETGWVAETPEGRATVRFSEKNAYGVLDHWVQLPGKPEVYIPLRMIKNGDGTEVELVLFRQPGMTDAQFAQDEASVKKDLERLKTILEAAH